MSTFLFVWNPSKDPESFDKFSTVVREAAKGKPYLTRWRCQSKALRAGDVVYMHRTGPVNNGIFARGVVIRDVHYRYGDQVAAIRLSQFISLGREISMTDISWSSRQNSNQQIPPAVLEQLERLWAERHEETAANASWMAVNDEERATFAQGDDDDDLDDDDDDLDDEDEEDEDDEEDDDGEDDDDEEIEVELNGAWLEGSVAYRMHAHRKREGQLRLKKLRESQQRHGGRLQCEVPGCGFDFEQAYGELGAGFAEVHHLIPLSEGERTTKLNELLVVCSNCHAMIHRGGGHRDPSTLRTFKR